MRWRSLSALAIFCLLVAGEGGLCHAQESQRPGAPSPRELYDELDKLSIDPAQIYVLRNAEIRRDRANIYFNRGYVGFLGPVAGEVTGAVFSGDGEILMIPPTSTEKASLARFTQSPVLEEKFTFAYMRFTDQTAGQLLAVARRPDPDDPDQPTGFIDQWDPVVHRLNSDFSIRILQDLIGDRGHPYFQAQMQGVNLGPFAMTLDQRWPDAVSVGAARIGQGRFFADTWCAFPSGMKEGQRPASTSVASHGSGVRREEASPVRIESYKIETQIDADNSMKGRTELELVSQSAADHLLLFHLSSRLRVSEVQDEEERKLTFFQSAPLEEAGSAPATGNWLAVEQPEAKPPGAHFRLTFRYQGNVIINVGNGVLYVGARESWYPNRGPYHRALYDLTFRYPDTLTLVATGNCVEQSEAGGLRHSRWVSEGKIALAGFNLGAYDTRSRQSGKTRIEVYATPAAEAALERRHIAIQRSDVQIGLRSGVPTIVNTLPNPLLPLAPSALLDQVAQNAASAVQYFETLFGPFPYPRLAIAQIPGDFGQGWPELVYLPTLAFLSGSERAEMGLNGKEDDLSDQALIAHEIAHQWWGNELGWKTDHDQWLSEGFASYAAALYLSQGKDGEHKTRDLMRGYKRDLMGKSPEGNSIESGGPIWLGDRLSNSINPRGYDNIVYKKACWVLHMLHVLMTDPVTGSDQRFFKMLRDFVTTYRGQSPSTEDFARMADKYMTPAMDLDRNHRLDWFFSDWVYSTGIPTYSLESTTQHLRSGKYLTQGSIAQSGVPADFEMLVPVVASVGGRKDTLGLVPVTESEGHFRFITKTKPARVTLNEDALLAVVR